MANLLCVLGQAQQRQVQPVDRQDLFWLPPGLHGQWCPGVEHAAAVAAHRDLGAARTGEEQHDLMRQSRIPDHRGIVPHGGAGRAL